MSFNGDNENALRIIRDLARQWLEHDCVDACNECAERFGKISDLAEERLWAIDGPNE